MPFALLTQYFDVQAQLFAYFGYVEDYRVIPLSDATDTYWMLDQQPNGTGTVIWASAPFTQELIEAGNEVCSASIYTQRFLPKWVYHGAEYTMVCADPHTDGNKLLMVFANDKRCEDSALLAVYNECWGEHTP